MSPETFTPDEPDVILTDESSQPFRDFARYSECIDERLELNRQLKSLEAEMARLSPRILAYFEKHSVQQVRLRNVLIFLRRELWARPKFENDRLRVCAVLQAVGLGQFVEPNFNTQTLSKYVRELAEANEDRLLAGASVGDLLPPELAAVLNVEPNYKIQGRKSR
jgi:hypothetical protein